MLGRLFSFVVVGLLARAGTAQAQGKAELQWFSQAGFKLTTPGGKVIMIDPWIKGATKLPDEFKDLSKLGKVDLILVTHGHGDHLGDAMEISKTNDVPMWAPAGLNQTLLTLGFMPAKLVPRMSKGGTIEPFPGVKITMVRAEHSSEMILKDPATGKDTSYAAGEPAGWIIQLENGFKIYHMGDTGLFGDMRLIGEYYKPDLIMIPIGGHSVMDPRDAAYATREMLKPRFAIPFHYGTFPTLKGTPQEYQAALGNVTTQVFPISPGDKLTF
jgi:L-ascorbate metabolism protein UlaG (beta-lactamase superfamily)